jgi:hypothetical protein
MSIFDSRATPISCNDLGGGQFGFMNNGTVFLARLVWHLTPSFEAQYRGHVQAPASSSDMVTLSRTALVRVDLCSDEPPCPSIRIPLRV